MDTAALENQMQTILDRLDQLGVSVTPNETDPYLEGPGFCSYRVRPDTGVAAHNVTGKLDDLKLALHLPAEMSIRSFVDRGAVVFEVPKDDDDRYFVDFADLLTRTRDDPENLAVPIGEDVHGNPVIGRLLVRGYAPPTHRWYDRIWEIHCPRSHPPGSRSTPDT